MASVVRNNSGFSKGLLSVALILFSVLWLASAGDALGDTSNNDHGTSSSPSSYASLVDDPDKRHWGLNQVVWDFLQIGFSGSLWLDSTDYPPAIITHLRPQQQDSDPRPLWISRFMRSDAPPPKSGVLNKWSGQEITIGLGWPSYTGDMLGIPTTETDNDFIAEATKKVIETITATVHLTVKFVPPNSPQEGTEDFARIRILPVDNTGLHNKYKSYVAALLHGGHRRPTPLIKLVGAVGFTPDSKSQVDGFFVPNKDNEIVFAACRLVPKGNKELVAALVTECILRSLGLPSVSVLNSQSFLGAWNSARDSISKTPKHDGPSAYANPYPPLSPTYPPLAEDVAEFERGQDVFLALRDKASRGEITNYDAVMLRLLYCPALKVGSDKLAAAYSILNSSECISIIKGLQGEALP